MQQNFIDEVLRLTNEFRLENNLDPLTLNAELSEAAQSHTENMANDDFFSHDGKDNTTAGQRAKDAGYDWNRVGENIAAGYKTPKEVVDGWIASPGHRANLLNPGFMDIGLGYFFLADDTGSVNYNTYWTQVFGAGDSVPAGEAPTPPQEESTPPPVTPETQPAAEQESEAGMDDSAMDTPAAEGPDDSASGSEDAGMDMPGMDMPGMDEPVADAPDMADPAPQAPMPEQADTEPMMNDSMDNPTTDEPMAEMPDMGASNADGADMNGAMGDMPMGDMHGMDHGGDSQMQMEHAEMEKLIDTLSPTHVATKSGDWSDPSVWSTGTVPGDNAKVLIEEGVTVNYDVAGSEVAAENARVETIAIRGNLTFPTNESTKLYVETILNGETGQLNIGSEAQKVDASQNVEIIFTSDGGVDQAWDKTQLTKGLVSHGDVNIYGADKLDKVALVGDAAAGNNVLTFKEAPTGWQVGDRIVLGGTGITWRGTHDDNSRFQDEVLEITSIDGNEVRFINTDITEGPNNVLRYDHTRSSRASDVNELELYVANLSRNVSFETENGADVPVDNRAHTMFMHSSDVNIVNARFAHLGRSDKREMVDDIGENVDGTPGNGTNIRGRYMLHLHQTGAGPGDGAANIEGNALEGGVGWGIVQHESNADIKENVVFDVVGSGIVAESGNERGSWVDNIVIKTTGVGNYSVVGPQMDEREDKFDLGFEGTAYWVQGASLLENQDNKAVSFERTGLELFGSVLNIGERFRPITTIARADLPEELQKLFPEGQAEVDIRDVPMSPVRGFQAYNGTNGISVWGHKTNFDGELEFSGDGTEKDFETAHLGRSLVEDFNLWNMRWEGLLVRYSSNIDIKNGQILGMDGDRVSGGSGIFNNHAAFNSQFDNVEVAGFEQGARLEFPNNDVESTATTLKNSTFRDNTYNLTKVGDEGPSMDGGRPDDYSAYLKLLNNTFAEVEGNQSPVARFQSRAIGGLGVQLDASASSDADPLRSDDGAPRPLDSKGIAMYGWDLDNDGDIDRFGRTIEQVFDSAGAREVTLTVLDSQGKATTTTKTVNVTPTAYNNAFSQGTFDPDTQTQDAWKANSRWADEGWFITSNASISNGVAKLSKPGAWNNFVGQVVQNDKLHKGQQTFSFRLQNVEGAPEEQFWKQNEVVVKLWGVNGQFDNKPWDQSGPLQVGTLPMNSVELFSETYGGEEGEHFDWRTISADLDLGDGFDYFLVQVDSSRGVDAGDKIAIDNISLRGPANAVPGTIPQGEPGPTVAAPQPNNTMPPADEDPMGEEPMAEETDAEDTGADSPTPDTDQPIPVEPDGGIGDGAGPLPEAPVEEAPAEEAPGAENPAMDEPAEDAPAADYPKDDDTMDNDAMEDDTMGEKGDKEELQDPGDALEAPAADYPKDEPKDEPMDEDDTSDMEDVSEQDDATDDVDGDAPMMEDPMEPAPNEEPAAEPVDADPMDEPVVDEPMGEQPTPETLPSIAYIVAQSGGEFDDNGQDFDLLLTALETAGLTDAVSAADADLTVLAPNDAAFVQLAQDLGFTGSDEAGAFDAIVAALTNLGDGDPLPLLQDVLKYHVSSGAQTLEELKMAGTIETLLEGASLTTDGVTLMDNEPDITDPSFLAELSDVDASNGIVQGIDRVLLPLNLPGNGADDAPMDDAPEVADPVGESPMDPELPADLPVDAPVDPIEPAAPMEPAQPMEPNQPMEPTQPMEPSFPTSLNPIARLSFEEASGRLAVDSSDAGMDNSGYLRRDATRIEGKMGQAVRFDGVGDVVTMNNSKDINLDIHGQRTLSMWFNADDANAEKKQVIYEEGGTKRGLNIYLEDGLLNVGGWNQPGRESGWGGSWLTTETGELESGKWHHVALVLDGSEALQDNALTAYLDGEEIGSMDASQLWRHPGRIGVGNVNGGTRFEDGIGWGRRDFGLAGGVDEVAIYNDALSVDQVKQLSGGMA